MERGLGRPSNPTTVRITAATAELQTQLEPRRDWAPVAGEEGDKAGEYHFRLDGKMPVDRARVILPANSVVRVTVSSRDKEGDPWELRAAKTVYLLTNAAGDVSDNEIRFNRAVPARKWRVVFDPPSKALGAADPTFELSWVPHDIVFVARGSAPFNLAYGNVGLKPAYHGVDELIRRLERDDTQRIQLQQAELGTPRTLRGEAARSVPWYRGDWKQWLLWGVLLLGVGALGFVALRLLKQLKAETVGSG